VARQEPVYAEPRYKLPKWERPDFSSPDPRPLSQLPAPRTGDGDKLASGFFGNVMARRQEKRYAKK
jgi:hypothetical protein